IHPAGAFQRTLVPPSPLPGGGAAGTALPEAWLTGGWPGGSSALFSSEPGIGSSPEPGDGLSFGCCAGGAGSGSLEPPPHEARTSEAASTRRDRGERMRDSSIYPKAASWTARAASGSGGGGGAGGSPSTSHRQRASVAARSPRQSQASSSPSGSRPHS